MTICITSLSVVQQTGGIPAYTRFLSSNLSTMGHRVILLSYDDKANATDEDSVEDQGNITLVTLKKTYHQQYAIHAPYFRPGSYDAPRWLAMGKSMQQWLVGNHTQFGIDIIEVPDYGGAGAFLIHDELPPVIITGHSSMLQLHHHNHTVNDDHSTVITQLEKFAYQYAAGVVTHSPQNVAELGALTGRKIFFARAPWVFPVQKNNEKVHSKGSPLIVSSLQLTKGAEIMAIASRLILGLCKDWQCDWIGGDTYTAPGNKRVSAYLTEKYNDAWGKTIRWIGEKDHDTIFTAIAQANCCVIPSVWDTFNYFALEAAFFEKPLIMTDTTGAVYLFENDPNVKIVPANDPAALASLLGNETALMQWKESITRGTKQMLLDYFSPGKIVSERMSVYHTIIRDRKPMGNMVTESLAFLEKYTTPRRKLYYRIRRKIKSIVKGK